MEFDLDTLYENLLAHPHTINGSFLSENVHADNEDDPNSPIIVDLSDGSRINIVKIENEHVDSGVVECSNEDGEQVLVQFFKPASLNDLWFNRWHSNECHWLNLLHNETLSK